MYLKVAKIAMVVAVPLVLIFFLAPRAQHHRITLKAYFTNGMGLRAGAPVRLAGVDIGSVKSVHAMPELKQFPVKVVIAIDAPYPVRIPSDSTANLETAGVLGETYVDINAAVASGPPISDGGTLKTIPVVQMNTQEFVQKIADAIGRARSACSPNSGCNGAVGKPTPPTASR